MGDPEVQTCIGTSREHWINDIYYGQKNVRFLHLLVLLNFNETLVKQGHFITSFLMRIILNSSLIPGRTQNVFTSILVAKWAFPQVGTV